MTIIDVDKITVMKAIKSLAPNAKCIVNENNSKDIIWSEGTTPISSGEIDAEIIRLQAEYSAQEYARNRQPLYPKIGDQLDDLYHAGVFSDEMTAKLKKVKDDNPK